MQDCRPRFRAEAGDEDAVGFHARRDQLISIRPGKIELKPIAGPGHEPSINRMSVTATAAERVDDVWADFSAALAQARSDCGNQVAGPAAELIPHRVNGRLRRPRRSAPPAGVHRTDSTGPLVDDQDGRTIGNSHADGDVRIV